MVLTYRNPLNSYKKCKFRHSYQIYGNWCKMTALCALVLHLYVDKTALWARYVRPSVYPHVCPVQSPNWSETDLEGWFFQFTSTYRPPHPNLLLSSLMKGLTYPIPRVPLDQFFYSLFYFMLAKPSGHDIHHCPDMCPHLFRSGLDYKLAV